MIAWTPCVTWKQSKESSARRVSLGRNELTVAVSVSRGMVCGQVQVLSQLQGSAGADTSTKIIVCHLAVATSLCTMMGAVCPQKNKLHITIANYKL